MTLVLETWEWQWPGAFQKWPASCRVYSYAFSSQGKQQLVLCSVCILALQEPGCPGQNYTLPYHIVGNTQLCSGGMSAGTQNPLLARAMFLLLALLRLKNLDWERVERLQPATGSASKGVTPSWPKERAHCCLFLALLSPWGRLNTGQRLWPC